MHSLNIAMVMANYAHRFASFDDWCVQRAAQCAALKAQGADIVLLPEYASVEWVGYAPLEKITPSAVNWQLAEAEKARHFWLRLSQQLDIAILAGSVFNLQDGKLTNRAHFFSADGMVQHQDKLCLTPGDQYVKELQRGTALKICHWRGLKIAILVCLDCEVPALAAALAKAEPDLLLIPSQTSTLAGYHRVFNCAQTRAIELFCPVAVVGGVGTRRFRQEQEDNVSGAALFLPCEADYASHGILQQIGPFNALNEAAGRVLLAQNVPVMALREKRQNGQTEAWSRPDQHRQFCVNH